MNETIRNKDIASQSPSHSGLLLFLFVLAFLLAGRLVYYFLADTERFPITTIKVAATYKHVTHKELEGVLEKYLDASFFSISLGQLQTELNDLPWVDFANVERVWPDALKIKLVEKNPIALWGNDLLTESGKLFNPGSIPPDVNVPKLSGPQSQQSEVLQVFEKLSKIISEYGLTAVGLELRDNQSWVLLLNNDTKIYLGKKDLETRLMRFCKAYPAVFAQKVEQLASVDLRYPRGMAVQWKQQMGR